MGRVRTQGLKALLGAGLVVLLVLLMPASALAFDDVPSGNQYFEAISDLSARGIITGLDARTFGPAEPVTRQQFAKMIVLTLAIPVSESLVSPFKDVTHKFGELYPYYYVAAAANRGITNGVTATRFNPYDNITRAQVITMVVRAVDALHPGILKSPEPGFVASWGNFSVQHAANAARAEANGLLEGLAPTGTALSSLAPLGFMSRGEVARVLHNLLDLLGGAAGPTVEPPLPPADPPVTPPGPPQPPVTPPQPPVTPPQPPVTPPEPPQPPVTPPEPPVTPPEPPPTPPEPPPTPPEPPPVPPQFPGLAA